MAGIIAGAVSVPLLVALYLLKLRRRPARVSSTLLWEQAVEDLQANVPFRWVRPSWLLLLQLLVLAGLIGALARPAIDAPGPGGDLVAIVIDASGSMSATDGASEGPQTTTRLDEAKARARDLVGRVRGTGAQAVVVSFASRPEALTEWSRDVGLLRRAIDSIEPTDQEADFDALLATIDALVTAGRAEVEGERAGRVVLLSDGDLRQTAASSATLGETPIDFVRVGPPPDADRDNVGIAAMSARRDIDDPALVRVFVRIVNAGARGREVGILLTLDGESIDAATVDVPGPDDQGRAGSAGATFEVVAERGLIAARLAVSDALTTDNTAALVLEPEGGVRVGLVTPGPLSSASEWALYDALDAALPDAIEPMTASEYADRATAAAGAPPLDLIVFDRVRPDALPAAPSISIGAALPIPGLAIEAGSGESGDGGGAGQGIAFWLRTHPVMRGVSLNTLLMNDPPVLRLPDGTGEASRRTRATPLASTVDGAVMALLEREGVRRIVIAPELASTNWRTDRSFPVFIANALDLLTGAGAGGGVASTTTTPITVSAPEGARVVLRGAGTERTTVGRSGGRATFAPIPRAGVYELTIGGDEPRPLAINMVSDRESAIATFERVDVAGRSNVAGVSSGSAPREVWAWLVIAAAILQAIEWVLFTLRSRV